MRLCIYVLLVVLTLGLSACGDDDDGSQPTSVPQPQAGASEPSPEAGDEGSAGDDEQERAGEGGGSSAGEGSSADEQASRERARDPGQRAADLRRLLRRRSRQNEFEGASRTLYHEARARCQAIPGRALARSYGAASEEPADIARAYAERQAPAAEGRRAAAAGCLDGIVLRLRRGL